MLTAYYCRYPDAHQPNKGKRADQTLCIADKGQGVTEENRQHRSQHQYRRNHQYQDQMAFKAQHDPLL